MNQKTDIEQEKDFLHKNEFAAGFLPSLILLTVVVLIGVVVSENTGWIYNKEHRAQYSAPPLFNFFPVFYPSYVTITNVIHSYDPQLELSFTPSIVINIGLLGSIIVFYSIIPTIFFFDWRRRRIENKSVSTNSTLFISSISYGLSTIIIAFIVVSMITATISGMFSEWKYKYFPDIHVIRSEMFDELTLISVDAYQYKLLPKEYGGGQGKYTGFALAPERAKTQNAIYSASINEKQVTIKAQSLKFPSGVINAIINEQGQLGNYQVEGVFK